MNPLVASSDPNNVFFRCVEDCSEAIMITDESGVLSYVNPAWEEIYGYTKEEAVGSSPKILHSGFQNLEFYKKMWNSILNPTVGFWKGELVNKAKNGTMIPVLLTITPVRGSQNQIVGHMGIASDLSAQKQLESKVLQQDRLASIGILASGLAHEVGTPLGVIRGRSEFLLMQPEVLQNQAVSSGLKVIVSQIDRITKLISSLLRFSRATDDVQNQNIDLMSVINEVLDLMAQNLRANAIEIKLEIPDKLKIFADFNRLQQVILNLVVNSLHAIQKAVQDGSQIAHSITIRAINESESSRVELSVIDTGCGIPNENMMKLFQPFFTTKDIGEGTGLGLAIVSKLVHEMNGEISVESVVNKGSKFTVLLMASN